MEKNYISNISDISKKVGFSLGIRYACKEISKILDSMNVNDTNALDLRFSIRESIIRILGTTLDDINEKDVCRRLFHFL